MSFVISILVFLIKQIWPFAILGVVIGFWATNHFRVLPDLEAKKQKRRKWFRNFFQAFIIILPGLVYLYGSYITNPLISYVGIETTGTVISQEKTRTLHNYQRIDKMNVAYLTEDGELQKSSFRTDERNFYPSGKRAVYPTLGQEFTLKYLPNIPRYFVIFNDSKKSSCRDLLRQVNELNALLQVAPNDSKLSDELLVTSENHMERCSNQPD